MNDISTIAKIFKREIRCKDITYCKADRCYTILFTKTNEKIILSKNLKQIENILKKHNFYRCHHSFLINKQYIISIDTINKEIYTNSGQTIPISTRKLGGFIQWYYL